MVGADYSIRHEQPGSLPVTSQPTTPVRVAPSSPSPSFLASPFCEIPDRTGAGVYGSPRASGGPGTERGCRADLSAANLFSADLSGANLSGARLDYANLSGANLSGAKLPAVAMVNALGCDYATVSQPRLPGC